MIADEIPLWANVMLFAAGAVGIWIAGRQATRLARALAHELRVGEAFVGMLLLGVMTSLPEIATTSGAAGIGDATLAGSNLLSGVALQMALLAAIDGIALRKRALTAACESDGLMFQAALLTTLCVVVVLGIGTTVLRISGSLGLWPFLLAAIYVIGVHRSFQRERRQDGDTDDGDGSTHGSALGRPSILLLVSAAAVLVGGYVVAMSASSIAEQTGVSASIVGASLVAISTSLPEITTTYTAVRLGSYAMAVGNILGTNALELALFLPADLIYRDGPIFGALGWPELAIALVNVALGSVLIWGLARRAKRSFAGFGSDSLLVLIIYFAGIGLVYYAL